MARDTTAWQADATPEEVERAAERVKAATGELEASIASIPNARLSEALLAVYRSAGREASVFQHAAEQWFDDSMERVSGWYKRRVQLFLLVIASVAVVPPERRHDQGRTGALAGRRGARRGGEAGGDGE